MSIYNVEYAVEIRCLNRLRILDISLECQFSAIFDIFDQKVDKLTKTEFEDLLADAEVIGDLPDVIDFESGK